MMRQTRNEAVEVFSSRENKKLSYLSLVLYLVVHFVHKTIHKVLFPCLYILCNHFLCACQLITSWVFCSVLKMFVLKQKDHKNRPISLLLFCDICLIKVK